MGSRESSSSRSRSNRKSRSRGRSYSISPLRNSFGTRLHIGDIDSRLTKKDIVKAFQKFGPLIEVWIARSSPCFGFVVFECREDAEEALDAMNGHTLGNSRLRVTYALPRVYERTRRKSHMGSRCYQCGKRGHFLRDCRRFQNRFRPRSPTGYYRSRSVSRRRSRGRSGGRPRDGARSRDQVRRRSRSASANSSSQSSVASVEENKSAKVKGQIECT